ncbi:hypothetical protein B0H66DRAFT_641651 [Apodospora peruviana]|uniref:Uncharacterized protein n=1 Tax=Apodospora peruviana TaxID=516989 RepID=A0AAE0I1K1_9PEZI|nr:hypothetical protein B0H66DRAFT_641651 [Apodospora peruviana]
MSGIHYTIQIANKTHLPQSFQIFTAKPRITGGETGQVFLSTLGSAPAIAPGTGFAEFVLISEYYAVCGSAPEPLASGGVAVFSESSKPVHLAESNGKLGSDFKLTVDNGMLAFAGDDIRDSTVSGAFSLNTMNETWDPSNYPNLYCGIGCRSPVPGTNQVVPVAVFAPNPNQKYSIAPVNKVYIAYSEQPSTSLQTDISNLGEVVEIDLTQGLQEGHTNATVTLQPDFTFSPVEFS